MSRQRGYSESGTDTVVPAGICTGFRTRETQRRRSNTTTSVSTYAETRPKITPRDPPALPCFYIFPPGRWAIWGVVK
eukprot:3739293-Rhodomonas_salina.1